jgi:hypothetical protein
LPDASSWARKSSGIRTATNRAATAPFGFLPAEAIIDQINLMPIWQRKPTARVLGERLRVTNGERERLKLWTIAPCDMGDSMPWWRKFKDRERKRRVRQLQGRQTRAAYLAKRTTSEEQPWRALGISRASWYRLLETSPSEVKLLTVTEQPVSPPKRQVSKKESAEKKLSTIKSEFIPQAEKPESRVTDTVGTVTAREISGTTCLTTERPAFSIGHNAGLPLDEQDLRGMPQDMSWYYKLRAA